MQRRRCSKFEDVQEVLGVRGHVLEIVLGNVHIEIVEPAIAAVLEHLTVSSRFFHRFSTLLWRELAPDGVHLGADIAVFASKIVIKLLYIQWTIRYRHDGDAQGSSNFR